MAHSVSEVMGYFWYSAPPFVDIFLLSEVKYLLPIIEGLQTKYSGFALENDLDMMVESRWAPLKYTDDLIISIAVLPTDREISHHDLFSIYIHNDPEILINDACSIVDFRSHTRLRENETIEQYIIRNHIGSDFTNILGK